MSRHVPSKQQDDKWRVQIGARPLGYCAAYQPIVLNPNAQSQDPAVQAAAVAATVAANAAYASSVSKHHTTGHATAEEARLCYRTFLLDTQLYLDGVAAVIPGISTEKKCAVCQAWTDKVATLDGVGYPLCVTHLTRASVETLYP